MTMKWLNKLLSDEIFYWKLAHIGTRAKEKHPFTVENLGSFKSFRGVREVIFGASVNNLQ